MLLRELTKYYRHHPWAMPLFGWELHRLRWVIILSEEGEFCDIKDLATSQFPKGVTTYMPRKPARTTKIRSCQLWDHPGYVLGISTKDPERAKCLHRDFISQCKIIAEATNDPGAKAVALFVKSQPLLAMKGHPLCDSLLKATAITFQLCSDDTLIFNRPIVHKWLSANPLSSGTEQGQCMICGKRRPLERIHPTIKGIKGCNPVGVRLIAVNNCRTGFSSLGAYGLTQGFCAPACETCAHQYSNALNHLLEFNSCNQIEIGHFTLLFWCIQSERFNFLFRKIILGGKGIQQFKDKKGKKHLKPSPTKLHWVPEPVKNVICQLEACSQTGYINIVLFRGKDRRATVEYYQRTQLTDGIKEIKHWLRCSSQPEEEPLPIYRYFLSLAPRRDIENLLAPDLLNFIKSMMGEAPIGRLVFRKLLHSSRNISNSPLLIRLIPFMSSHFPKDYMSSKPFICGQLLAVLVKCQEEANGEATTIQCNAASIAAPARKFVLYLKKNRHHLKVIGSNNPGRRVNLENRIQTFVSQAFPFPELLDLDEQSVFLGGYYHQKKSLFSPKNEK
ncbi:type I-C CRISPR-associated protein Cas8c/Csd1 [Endozoicomonadaceae bacterium StTr2]